MSKEMKWLTAAWLILAVAVGTLLWRELSFWVALLALLAWAGGWVSAMLTFVALVTPPEEEE